MKTLAPSLWQPYQPGAFSSLPFETYRTAPGINNSALSHFAQCPREFQQYTAGNIPDAATEYMVFGSMGHGAILEGKFNYTVRPETYGDGKKWNGNATECKQWYAEHDGETVLTAAEDAELRGVSEYIRFHPLARGAISSGQPEVSLFARDPGTGLLLKGRADWLSDERILDVKFVQDASSEALARLVINRRYHVQLAVYRRLARLLGMNPPRCELLAVERNKWHAINIREIPQGIVDIGEFSLDRELEGIAECYESGQWPDYSGASEKIKCLPFPEWAYAPPGGDKTELIIGGKSHAL